MPQDKPQKRPVGRPRKPVDPFTTNKPKRPVGRPKKRTNDKNPYRQRITMKSLNEKLDVIIKLLKK